MCSQDMLKVAVLEDIVQNWVYPQSHKTEIALTWIQEYVNNVRKGNPVSLTGDESNIHKNEQV